MRNSKYSSVDPVNGNVSWNGPLSQEKGDHTGMPSRTEAYLPSDEKGHVNASSLGGGNSNSNVVAQNKDLNHGAYLSVENGERNALRSGATINSEKIAIVDSQPGDRPSTFMVNDTVTYADGHSENIHNSFTNESNANQVEWNNMSSAFPDTYDGPNPEDALRELMGTEEYADLMERTDAELFNLAEDYAPSDFYGDPYAIVENESDVSSSISDDLISDMDIDDIGIDDVGIDDDGIDDGIDDGMGI